MKPMRRLLCFAAIATSLCATSAYAQGSRSAMVDSARALIDDFNERQSLGLLRRALNPALGAPDASWARGVQLLGQTLLQQNQRDEAVAWLRWALRQSPTMPVDSVNFTPVLVNALQEARAFVAASRAEPRVAVRFEWSTSTTSGGFGDLQIARGTGAAAAPLQLSADGAFLDEGLPRRLSPGSYRIAARAAGQRDAEFTAEVLPGVTTLVTVNFVAAVVGMSTATEQLVLSRLVRVGPAEPSQGTCSVGVFAGGPRLLLTSYKAMSGGGSFVLQSADGPLAPEDVMFAASNAAADLAVLAMTVPSGDSLPIARDLRAGASLWAAHYPACGDKPALARVAVASVTTDSIVLTQDVSDAGQNGVLVDSSGAVTGLLVGPRTARRIDGGAPLWATARANLSSGTLRTLSQAFPKTDDEKGRTVPPKARKGRSKLLPIVGGVVAGGIVAALAMPKSGSKPTTGGIVLRLP